MSRTLFLALLAPLLLSACSSFSRQDCQQGQWRQLGERDARQGLAEQSAELGERCSEFGIDSDSSDYLRGYRQGLEAYCQPASGFQAGRRGQRYQQICPAHLEDDFLRAYQRGERIHSVEQRLRQAEQDLRNLELNWNKLPPPPPRNSESWTGWWRERDRLERDTERQRWRVEQLENELHRAERDSHDW